MMKDRVVLIIQARMGSTRLPGKSMMDLAGAPLVGRVLERVKRCKCLDDIVLATTTNSDDDSLVKFANNEGIQSYRGSEDDVMGRVIGAAESVDADLIVEITGDCPIIDPSIVEQTIQTYINNNSDYVSNAHIRSYPDGMDVQVFSLNVLKKSSEMTNNVLDHEHVTLHIRNHPELFSHLHLVAPPELWWPELGLTLDEISDFELLKNIIEYFGESNHLFSCYEAIKLLRDKPDWVAINQKVVRKGDT